MDTIDKPPLAADLGAETDVVLRIPAYVSTLNPGQGLSASLQGKTPSRTARAGWPTPSAWSWCANRQTRPVGLTPAS